ncbi:MAG: TRAP transporter substrate-binding protein DctP [Clostridium sp.]
MDTIGDVEWNDRYRVVNQSTIGNFINDFQALDIPYLITSTEQADAVFLGDIGTRFLDKLSGVQLYGLGIWESGFRNLTNSKRDVNSVDDVAGLKIRTMENQVHIAFWKAMGADATPMSWGEAPLRQGALDGKFGSRYPDNNVAQSPTLQ